MKKLVSIITPMYNEEENIEKYFLELNKTTYHLKDKYDFEFIITDNHSTDKTFDLLIAVAKKDKRIKIFRFSKNFGYQKSIWTGYSKANGDCAIEFDADLQDPPVLLSEFLKKWEEGNKIVYGIRTKRHEGCAITFIRKCFYRILSRITENDLPIDAGDFLLIDRQIVNLLREHKDQNPYIRGIIFGFGFKRIGIEYERQTRNKGISKFPFGKCLSLAIDGIISQSVIPLRIASFVGIIITLLTSILSGVYIILKLVVGTDIPAGFTTTILLILFSISINALFLGIIGEYIARIYKQVNTIDITIIEKTYPKKNHQLNPVA